MQKKRERERKSSFGGIKWDRDRNEKNKLEIMTTTRTRTHTQHSTHAHTRKTNDDQRESIVLFFFPFSLQLFFWVNFYFCVCVPYVRETTLRPNTSRLKLVSSNKKVKHGQTHEKHDKPFSFQLFFFLLLICLKLTKRPLGVLSCYSATVPRPDNQKVIINSTKTVLH